MFKTLIRTTTPLIAFGVGFSLFPRDFRKGSLFPKQINHFNEEALEQLKLTPEYQKLANDVNTSQHYASSSFPSQHHKNYVSSGVLFGPDLNEIDPVVFTNDKDQTLTVFSYLGKKMTGQDGQIHNGAIATILDEGLCKCGFPLLPSKKGVTAKLILDFQNQAPPNSVVVLRAKVDEAKGRKVVISGNIQTLPLTSNEQPIKIAEAKCILVEPKWFKYFSWLQVF